LVRAAIASAPPTELARLQWQSEQALGRGLRAGTHEWNARAAIQRRSERSGGRFVEREVGLERAIRLGDKAALDGRLADAGISAALSGYEDAWHETARNLMKAWFDLAREDSTVHSLSTQITLSQRQLRTVQQRVAAGDAPRLEALLAQGELARDQAALSNATQRARFMRIEFERRYPSLQGLALRLQDLDRKPLETDALTQNAATLEQTILAENHEIELAKAQTELARLRMTRVDRDRRADPTIGMRFAQERGGQDTIVGVNIAIPFGTVARDARAEAAVIEANKAEVREREVLTRVGYEARQTTQAVAQSQDIAEQLTVAADKASAAADLAAIAYTEGEMPLGSLLQARRQAGESQLSATLAQVSAHEARARALLDAHLLWTPSPLEAQGPP
jgi:outer membrane protein TolC